MEGKEEWSQYAERLDHFLSANAIADEKKKDVFLSVIGPQTYKLLKSLVAPAKPGEKEYNRLVQAGVNATFRTGSFRDSEKIPF